MAASWDHDAGTAGGARPFFVGEGNDSPTAALDAPLSLVEEAFVV